MTPAYEFGRGLSYTTFSYTDVKASSSGVSFTLKNTGSRDGAATPQLYLGFPASAGEPPKQLKGACGHLRGVEERALTGHPCAGSFATLPF